MAKFTPFEKLSKKTQKELSKKRRTTWGAFNPTTRKPADPKVYNRKKARSRGDDNHGAGFFHLFH